MITLNRNDVRRTQFFIGNISAMITKEIKPFNIFIKLGCLYYMFVLLLPAHCKDSEDVIISNQTKRDLSISYAATDFDSKKGTRIKTITVIKNIGGHNKQNQPLAIDPKLHKNEEWGSAFRDNFDSYGKIPDVPDIDDLFKFVKMKTSDSNEMTTTAAIMMQEEEEKPVVEDLDEMKSTTPTSVENPVEKIKGEVELLSNHDDTMVMATSESISMSKNSSPKPNIKNNSISSDHAMKQQQKFDRYIQLSSSGNSYNDDKPCETPLPESILIRSASGRSYDAPVNKQSNGRPYLAPAVAKRKQVQTQIIQLRGSNQLFGNRPQYKMNSILPPLALNGASVSYQFQSSNRSQYLMDGDNYPTASRTYGLPNIRNGLAANQPPVIGYTVNPLKVHKNILSLGNSNGVKKSRSRGLRY